MKTHTPFITPLCEVPLVDHLDNARLWFEENTGLLKTSAENGFLTTLTEYFSNEHDVFSGTGVEAFISDVEKVAKEFLYWMGYATDKWIPKMNKMWLNDMPSSSAHVKHSHYGAVLSGCFYVVLPEGSANIQFYGPASGACKPVIPIREYTVFNSDSWTMYPKEGDLFMWMSHIFHDVPNYQFSGNRKSIAFDLVLKETHAV